MRTKTSVIIDINGFGRIYDNTYIQENELIIENIDNQLRLQKKNWSDPVKITYYPQNLEMIENSFNIEIKNKEQIKKILEIKGE